MTADEAAEMLKTLAAAGFVCQVAPLSEGIEYQGGGALFEKVSDYEIVVESGIVALHGTSISTRLDDGRVVLR